MTGSTRRAFTRRLGLAVTWDDDSIVVCHGDRYVVCFGGETVAYVRAWRDDDGDVPHTLAFDLPHGGGSVLLDCGAGRFDEFIAECESRLPGWRIDWADQVSRSPEAEVTVWKRGA